MTPKLYSYIAAAVVVLAMGAYILWQQNSITKLKGELKLKKQEYTQCIDVNNNLKTSIKIQNDAVETLQKQTASFQDNLKQLQTQLDAAKKNTTQRISTIYQLPAPADKSEAFDQLTTFMKQEVSKW